MLLWRTTVGHSYLLRFCDGLATTTLAFAVPLMIYHATRSLTWSGLAFFIEWVPRIITLPISSPFVDALGSRKVFMATNLLRALVLGVSTVLVVLFPHAWPMLLAIAVVTGVLAQCSFVAAEHLGVHITEKSVQKTQSIQVGIDQAVQVLGPVLGGMLFWFGQHIVLAGVGALAGIAAGWAYSLSSTATTPTPQARQSVLAGFKTGWRGIMTNQSLRMVVAGTAAFNVLLGIILASTPALTAQRYGSTEQDVSLLWACGAFAAICAVFLLSTIGKRLNLAVLSLWAGLMAIGAAIGATLAPSFVTYAAAISLFMAMDGLYAVFIRTARAHIVPSAEYGVTVGVIVLLSVIPFPLAGLLTAATPEQQMPLLVGGCGLLTATVLVMGSLRIDRRIFSPTNTQDQSV